MDADRFARIKDLLIALEDVPAAERAAHLDRVCGEDASLRAFYPDSTPNSLGAARVDRRP